MRKPAISLDALIAAMLKLDIASGERRNVVAFIQSCYAGRVRVCDADAAEASLMKLDMDEQHALIEWVLQGEEAEERRGVPA